MTENSNRKKTSYFTFTIFFDKLTYSYPLTRTRTIYIMTPNEIFIYSFLEFTVIIYSTL